MPIFGDIARSVGDIVRGIPLPGMMQSTLGSIGLGDQRQAFIALLLATASGVGQKPNFNLDLEMNDLWIRMGSLKQSSPGADMGGLGGLMNSMNSMNTQLQTASQIQTQLHAVMQSLVGNMR